MGKNGKKGKTMQKIVFFLRINIIIFFIITNKIFFITHIKMLKMNIVLQNLENIIEFKKYIY